MELDSRTTLLPWNRIPRAPCLRDAILLPRSVRPGNAVDRRSVRAPELDYRIAVLLETDDRPLAGFPVDEHESRGPGRPQLEARSGSPFAVHEDEGSRVQGLRAFQRDLCPRSDLARRLPHELEDLVRAPRRAPQNQRIVGEAPEHRIAEPGPVRTQSGKYGVGDSIAHAEKTEQDVLHPDEVVAEGTRMVHGFLEGLLCERREGALATGIGRV